MIEGKHVLVIEGPDAFVWEALQIVLIDKIRKPESDGAARSRERLPLDGGFNLPINSDEDRDEGMLSETLHLLICANLPHGKSKLYHG